MNLTTLDLNLLVALDALLREKNVSKAAVRLGLSQPAASHALARLREVLGDPLLVRVGRSMEHTPRAEALVPEVEAALRAVESVFQPPGELMPAELQRTFRVVLAGYSEMVLLFRLVPALAEVAPGASIFVSSLGEHALSQGLRTGELDLAIGVSPGAGASDVHVAELFRDAVVGIARSGHPAISALKLTPSAYAGYLHVDTAPKSAADSALDQALSKRGLARRALLTVPTFHAAPSVVAHTEAVALLPERLARAYARTLPIATFRPPLPLPSTRVLMAWHARAHTDPAHRFFRELIRRVVLNT